VQQLHNRRQGSLLGTRPEHLGQGGGEIEKDSSAKMKQRYWTLKVNLGKLLDNALEDKREARNEVMALRTQITDRDSLLRQAETLVSQQNNTIMQQEAAIGEMRDKLVDQLQQKGGCMVRNQQAENELLRAFAGRLLQQRNMTLR
jgi:hypothetical protein